MQELINAAWFKNLFWITFEPPQTYNVGLIYPILVLCLVAELGVWVGRRGR